MYVCNCNAITQSDVARATDEGASHWKEVHTHFQQTPCCGMCENEMTEAIGGSDLAGTENDLTNLLA